MGRFNVLEGSRTPASHHVGGEDPDAPFSSTGRSGSGPAGTGLRGIRGLWTATRALGRSRVVRFLAKRLPDKRDGRRIRHSQKRLARTLLLLAGQGRREHGDATELRDDPALRLATGDRAGTAPLGKAGRLPSQPTRRGGWRRGRRRRASRCCGEGLQRLAGWRLKAMGGWRRPKTLVIDVDSLPVEARGTAGQRVERLLSPARVSSDRGGGGGDGRHPGPAAARGAGAYGGRRAGVRAGGAGAGGAASVREGRRALRRGISRRAADGGAGGVRTH